MDAVSALAPEYPTWVLPLQGADRLSQLIAGSVWLGEQGAHCLQNLLSLAS